MLRRAIPRLQRLYLDCLAVAAFCLSWETLRLGGLMETIVAGLIAYAGWMLAKPYDDQGTPPPGGGGGMPHSERVTICLDDGRQLCVTIRARAWWRLAMRFIASLCGVVAVLLGGWLLSQGYKDSAVYAAVAGFGLLVMAKE